MLLTGFLSAALGVYFLLKNENLGLYSLLYIPTPLELKNTFNSGINQLIINGSNGLFTNSIIPIATYLFGNYEAGIYASAEKIIKAFQLLVNPMIVGIQKLFLDLSENRKIRQIFWYGFFIFSILTFSVMTLSPKIAVLITVNEKTKVSEIISLLSLSILSSYVFTFCNISLSNNKNAEGLLKFLFVVVFIIGLFLIAVNQQKDIVDA